MANYEEIRVGESFRTSEELAEVAYDVGFADPSYFTRVFVEVEGRTPTQFRLREFQS